MSLIFS